MGMRTFFILSFLLIPGFLVQAQDIIHRHTGETIEATIVDISPGVIKYKKYGDPQGPVYSIAREQVEMIVYADGKITRFEKEEEQEELPEAGSQEPIIRPSPTFGWHIGIGTSSIYGDIAGARARLASAIGVDFLIPFGKNNGILLGADVLSLGCSFEDIDEILDDGTRVVITNSSEDLGYLSILVADRYFLNRDRNYYFEGGFYGSFLISAFINGDAEITDTSGIVTSGSFNDQLFDFYKAYDLGILAGVGGRIPLGGSKKWHLLVGARFYYGLTNIWDPEIMPGSEDYIESNIFGFVFVGVDIPTRKE